MGDSSREAQTAPGRIARETGDLMPPIRVLIVDDSVFVREALNEVLGSDPDIEIVGTASGSEQALSLLKVLRPSLVTLDLSLPGMNGFATLAEIRKISPDLPVILSSTFTEPFAWIKLEALAWAATSYIKKPAQADSSPWVRQQFRDELISKIKFLCTPTAPPFRESVPAVAPAPKSACTPKSACAPVEVVAIGASTGGPEALAELIAKFPADFPAPVLIVQHMPPNFTRHLAERLDLLTPLRVREGKAGQRLGPGDVLIAPGDYHMTVARHGSDVVLMTNQCPPEQGCRPSVDVLFRSVAQAFGSHVLGVVLTGMGGDGTSGAQAIWEAGGEVIVQDEATSAIWGMPGRVVAAGLASTVCPLGSVPFAIISRVYASRGPAQIALAAVAR
jgi:two-component system, chemotaxis family, protein-glutamate methylesterase/glutaminase